MVRISCWYVARILWGPVIMESAASTSIGISHLLSLQKATAIPAKKAEYFDSSEPVQNRVYKSLKVWSMLADLEESLGTFKVSELSWFPLCSAFPLFLFSSFLPPPNTPPPPDAFCNNKKIRTLLDQIERGSASPASCVVLWPIPCSQEATQAATVARPSNWCSERCHRQTWRIPSS